MTEDLTDAPSFKRGIIRAPFDKTTIRHLMVLQTRHDIHPYTCANRGDGKHEKIGGQTGILIPTVNGWVCPDCDYTQDWVHNSFLNAIIFDVAFDEPTHAPTPAPTEVIERYARDLRMHNETRPLANTREKQEETLRAILTRFASEIGTVDAGKVWDELWAIYVKLNGPFEDRDDYEDIITVSKTDLIAALKSAGGGKDGNNG